MVRESNKGVMVEEIKGSDRWKFHIWITNPPYEKSISRYGDNSMWTGQYKDYSVQLAWEAWLGSKYNRD